MNNNYDNLNNNYNQVPNNGQNQISNEPLFSNQFNNQAQNNFNVANNYNQAPVFNMMAPTNLQSNDVPPDLGPIQNLNEAPLSQAPTMDALGPMNVMPNSINNLNTVGNTPFDPLDAYENNIPVANQNIVQQPINNMEQQPYFNNPILPENSNFINNQQGIQNQTFINNDINNLGQGQPQFNNITSNDNVGAYNNLNNNFNPMYSPNFSNAPLNNSIGITPENTSVENNNIVIPQENTNIENNNINNNSLINNDDQPEKKVPSYELVNDKLIDNQDQKTDEDYNIINTNLNSEDIKEQSNLVEEKDSDIEDMVEDEEIDQKLDTKEDLKEEKTPGSVSKCVDEIKETINQIKLNGFDVEIEEFDFEEMFQLVVKIKK